MSTDYTGADLQSLVYNAFLKSVQRAIDNGHEDNIINMDDFIESFRCNKLALESFILCFVIFIINIIR